MNSKGIFFLYRLLQALLSPFVLLYFQVRVLRDWRYLPTLWQRLGFLPNEYRQTAAGALWFHAVSVGEVIAIAPLVERARREFPLSPVFVSTTTLAGLATARQRIGPEVFYAPIDYVFAVRRVLRFLRPSILIVAETEIWPNLFREAKHTGCALILVNARISDRTTARYSALRLFFRAVLRYPDRILAQTPELRERFLRAGAPPASVRVGGNLKYDSEPTPAPPEPFFSGAKIWIAASTSADDRLAEEDAILMAFADMPGWKLVLAPRKPERFPEVARKLDRSGLSYTRRSAMDQTSAARILLLDTIGELAGLLALADVVFVGGTLANRGGHNILEPAFFAKPIVIGPHMQNFREMAAEFRAARAILEIRDASELRAAILQAAADPALGCRARACAAARRGAAALALSEISALYRTAIPWRRRSLPGRLFLTPLSRLWKFGSDRRRAKDLRAQRRLPVPVISIGNITVGGTGKTPLVLHVAQFLQQEGRRPGVLTRGYGRNSPHKVLTLAPGIDVPVTHTGDEPQVILRSRLACVGIGADRYETGLLLRERLQADIMVLDDGFQHLRLARDLDIVSIDALNPFGESALVPLGRLREPLDALARARVFIITRTDCVSTTAAIEARLRHYNHSAPIFRSRVVPEAWVSHFSGEIYPPGALPFARTLAFCGLGNAEAFWRSLRELGLSPLDHVEYSDHHQYTPREVRRLGMLARAHHIDAFLTTEKDIVNLCSDTAEVIDPVKMLWLKIRVEIENETALQDLLRAL